VTVSRRDRDIRKNTSRPSRDRDVRDRDYNPAVMFMLLQTVRLSTMSESSLSWESQLNQLTCSTANIQSQSVFCSTLLCPHCLTVLLTSVLVVWYSMLVIPCVFADCFCNVDIIFCINSLLLSLTPYTLLWDFNARRHYGNLKNKILKESSSKMSS